MALGVSLMSLRCPVVGCVSDAECQTLLNNLYRVLAFHSNLHAHFGGRVSWGNTEIG